MRGRVFKIRACLVLVIVLVSVIGALGWVFNEHLLPQLAIVPSAVPTLPKKLIEYGWDVPSPAFVVANIQAMEQRPFNGIVVRLTSGPNIFNHASYPDATFNQDIQDLMGTRFSRFTDNFVLVWSSSEQGWNFLSDTDWAAAERNLQNFAHAAAAGGFKGIFFDTETYGQNTWAYNPTIYPNTTFDQVQAVVRQRGARFMTILQSELPGAKVLSTWLLEALQADYYATSGNLAYGNSPLLGAFMEGMFTAATGVSQLIDGNEMSYNYTDAKQFDQSRSGLFNAVNLLRPEYQEIARSHLQIGQAIYADQLLNLTNSPRSATFYIANQQDRLTLLEHNLFYALRDSDEYVWFYSEKVEWWKKPSIPDGLEDSIRRVEAAIASTQELSYDLSFLDAANKALSQAIDVTGRVKTKDGGQPGQRAIIGSGLHNLSDVEMACSIDANNRFDCKLPNGWSGTLTPYLKGYQFDPPTVSIDHLTQNYHIDFVAIPVTQ